MSKLFKQSYKYLIALVLGVGITLMYSHWNTIFSKGSSSKIKRKYKVSQAAKSVRQNQPKIDRYTNPLIALDSYKKMNVCNLDNLEIKINQFLKSRAQQLGVTTGVYFRDLNTSKYISINGDMSFGPASLMKVPIMIAALKQAEENGDLMKASMQYEGDRAESYRQFPGKSPGKPTQMQKGNLYSVNQLLEYMIVESDNEATVMLLDKVGLDYVEKTENILGFLHPHNFNPYGEVMTLRRYSSFFRTLYNASYLSEENSNLALDLLARVTYKQGLRRLVPSDIEISHKYGSYYLYDDMGNLKQEQLHHVGIVYYPNKPYLIGIITKGKKQEQCERVIAELSQLIYNEVDQNIKQHPATYLNRDIAD